MRHVVAISGGKDSTALALRLTEVEPRDYDYLITPTGNELADLMEPHWSKLESLLGKPLVRLKPFGEGDGLLTLIHGYKAVPNWRQRWCTRQLKIEPTIAWLKENAPCVQYVGLRADEEERVGIYGDMPGVEQRYPFREWGWEQSDVWNYLADRGMKIPRRTDCAWRYGQRLKEWYELWQHYPQKYEEAVQLEKDSGHTFRSAQRDTWPTGLAELRTEFEHRLPKGIRRAGAPVQLDLFEQGDDDQQACRVCRL